MAQLKSGSTVGGIPITTEATTWPVGSTYIQFPGKSDPGSLGLPGTWDNVSSEFAGDFFRAEGGNAASFGNGQSDQNESHDHHVDNHTHSIDHDHGMGNQNNNHDHDLKADENDSTGHHARGTVAGHVGDTYYSHHNEGAGWITGNNSNHSHNVYAESGNSGGSTPRVSHQGGNEARPVNQTVRIWERVS